MSRGLWRWWVEKDGADQWWARVEVRHGEWQNLDMAAYERGGIQPSFWDLPLEEEYMEAALRDAAGPAPTLAPYAHIWMLPAIIVLTGAGGVFFLILLNLALVEEIFRRLAS